MAEAHVISALRDKRSELAGVVNRLEQELVEHRTNLAHLDATMRLFDPDIRPEEIRPRRLRDRSLVPAWRMPAADLRRAARRSEATDDARTCRTDHGREGDPGHR